MIYTMPDGEMDTAYNLPLETSHLILRKWCEADFSHFNALCQASLRGDFFTGWAMEETAAKDFFTWQLAKYECMDPLGDVIGLAIVEKCTKQIIGHGGIGKHEELAETEIFYGLLPSVRRQGYGTEVAQALTNWAFATFPLPYLIGTVTKENVASQKVLERSGYTFIEEQVHTVAVLGQALHLNYYRCQKRNKMSTSQR